MTIKRSINYGQVLGQVKSGYRSLGLAHYAKKKLLLCYALIHAIMGVLEKKYCRLLALFVLYSFLSEVVFSTQYTFSITESA